MCVTLQTDGGTSMKGTALVHRPGTDSTASCATWVRGEGGSPGQISLPSAFDTTIGGRTVRFGGHISGYTGPGVYDGPAAISSGNNGFALSVDSRFYASDVKGAWVTATVKAEIRPDGSGSVTFANLVSTGSSTKRRSGGGGPVSGSYTWTCQD